MIPHGSTFRNFCAKVLIGIPDCVDFISSICALYFNISDFNLTDIINNFYFDIVSSFINQKDPEIPLTIYFKDDLSYENGVDFSNKIVVSYGKREDVSDLRNFILFYKLSSSNKSKKGFILLPLVSTSEFPLNLTVLTHLKSLLTFYSASNTHIIDGNTVENKHISEKLRQILFLTEDLEKEFVTDDPNFPFCKSLIQYIDTDTKTLKVYEIKINDEFVLEDIKSNVREWSTEIFQIIKRYLSMFSEDDEYDTSDISDYISEKSSISSGSYETTSSSFDTSNTSSDTSDTSSDTSDSSDTSVIDNSFLTLKTSKIQRLNTGLVSDIYGYVHEICSNSIKLFEEIEFWNNYQIEINELRKKMESPNFVNTLLLLEYNGISVENIYSFKESKGLVSKIVEEVKEINSFMAEIKVDNFIKCEKLSDFPLLIEKMFTTLRKYKHLRYMKSDRLLLLFNSIILNSIYSVSRILSIELNQTMEENHKVLMKSIRIVYELKSKTVDLVKYFEKHNQLLTLNNNMIIILDLYRDILQSVCKIHEKFVTLNSDMTTVISELSEYLEDNSELDNCPKLITELNEINASVSESNGFFVESVISGYSNLNEGMENVLKLDDVIFETKYKVENYRNEFLKCVNSYLYSLDLFEAFPVIEMINSLDESECKNMLVFNVDVYIDKITDEYDKIIHDIDDNDYEAVLIPIRYDNIPYKDMVIRERIMNLVHIVDVLNTISSKSILKTTKNNLNELLKSPKLNFRTMNFNYSDEHISLGSNNEYREKYLPYITHLDRYHNLLKHHIFTSTDTILDEISIIRQLDVEVYYKNIYDDINLIEKIYKEYMYFIQESSELSDKFLNIIGDKSYLNHINISTLVRVYKIKRDEIQSFLEFEKNNYKIRSYFTKLKQDSDDVTIEYKHISIEFCEIYGLNQIYIYSIDNIDYIIDYIDDNITKLLVIKSSKCDVKVLNNCDLWICAIEKSKLFVENFKMFNDKFQKLLNIVSCKFMDFKDHGNIICSLKEDIDKLSEVNKLRNIEQEHLLLFQSMIKRVDDIEKVAKKRLNDIRYKCPRLYFINDADLVELVGGSDMDLFLSRIFPGIARVITNENIVSGIESSQGEIIIFDNKIDYCSGDNIKFINELDSIIKCTIKRLFTLGLEELKVCYSNFNFDDIFFSKWSSKYPTQILILTLCICWTESVEYCKSFTKILNFLSKIINSIVSNTIDVFDNLKYYQLFLLLNYQINKTREIEMNNKSKLCWLKCVRYYHENDDVIIKIMYKEYKYSFNYLFNCQKMITTKVTEHFYSIASMTLSCNLLPSAQGPAGTGKTETIKSLSYIAGSNVMVFNLSELYEVEDMEKILSGLYQLGFWGIFDEFNRLSECVLSSVTEKLSNKNITLLDRNIQVNRNSAIFITMNPGYSGRSELPLNCLNLCQQFFMEKIDLHSILNINLKIFSFKFCSKLSDRIIFLLNSLDLVFTSSKFDFGLRFVKNLLNMIKNLITTSIEWTNEYDIFLQSLNRLLLPRLTNGEKELYKYFIKNNAELKYSDDELEFVELLKLSNADEIISNKSLEIYNMSKISSLVILFGESGTGKSLSFDKFIECIEKTKEVEVVKFDPNSLDTCELYGYMDGDDWIEGLIPKTLKSNPDKDMYIVFDGDLKQEWVENLNSLLDDNRILTLSNGDRISLRDNVKIFLETDSLKDITPATVSRSTIVFFDCKINTNSLISSDIQPDSLVNELESFIIKCNDSYESKFLKKIPEQYVTNTIYLSQGLGSSDIINYLYSVLGENVQKNAIEDGSKRTIILVKDIHILNDTSKWSSLCSIFRQMIKYKFFYRYLPEESEWIKIHLDGIVFVFCSTYECGNKCRLLSMLKEVVLTDCSIEFDEFSQLKTFISHKYGREMSHHDLTAIKSLLLKKHGGWLILKHLQSRFNDNSLELIEQVKCICKVEINPETINNSVIKCKSVEDTYNFIYLTLLYNESFLYISGPSVSGKSFLSRIASTNLGFDFIEAHDMSKDDIVSIIISCGLNNKKCVIFINIDIVVDMKLYFIVKNMISKEYSVVLYDARIRDFYDKNSISIPYDDFINEFKMKINDNIRFIVTGNNIEHSLIDRLIKYNMPCISYDEYVLMSHGMIEDSKELIPDIYNVCKEYVGDGFINYIFILKMTKHWYQISFESNVKLLKHLNRGIDKIKLFKNNVDKMESSLNQTRCKLDQMNIESETKIKFLEIKRKDCEEKRKLAMELANSLKERKSILDHKKQMIKSQINNINPLIEKAKEDVENINKRSLEELKSMNNPPFIVKYTIETVSMILKNGRKIQWDDAKKLLKSPDFITKIILYDIENMQENVYNMLKERLQISEWDVNRIFKASKAAGPLAKWANSILICYEIYKQVIPLKNEIIQIEEEYIRNENILSEQNLLISQSQNEIEQNQLDYEKNIQLSSKIQNEIEINQNELIVSKKVIDDLTNELLRWNKRVSDIENHNKYLLCISTIEAIMPIYVSLDYNTRTTFIQKCIETLKKNFENYSFDIKSIFNIEKYIIERYKKLRHFVVLDSSESEYTSLIQGPYSQVSCCDVNFIKVLNSVKSLSGSLLVKDIHCCDVNIKLKILNEFKEKVDVETDFTMYIISTNEYFGMNKCVNKCILESIYNRAIVLNMKLNSECFLEYTKNKIIDVLEPEIYSLYINSNKNIDELNCRINDNETRLLDKLVDLDVFDPDFVKFIDEYKQVNEELDSSLNDLKKSYQIYEQAIDSKLPLIELLYYIYREIEELGNLNKLYCFDYNALFYFTKALYNRDNYITDIIILTYNWISEGILETDGIIWGTKMLRILSKYNNEVKKLNDSSDNTSNSIQHLINNYLKSQDYNDIILDYYDTIILLTDGFEDPVHISESISNARAKCLDVYAVGSLSEMTRVTKSMVKSLKMGNYIILKNIHLSKTWINKIETDFLNKYKSSKIFLTCDMNVELSKNMLLSCHKILSELTELKGLISHLFNIFANNSDLKCSRFILLKCVVIHSIIILRQVYIPFGWSKKYNFNTNDLKIILTFLSESLNKSDIDQVKTSCLINDIIKDVYTAKITCEIDLKLLDDIIQVSDQRVQESDDIETWIENNSLDDGFAFIGFTKYTQNEIFNSKICDNKSCIEYDGEYKTELNTDCKVFQNFIKDEIAEATVKKSVNPLEHTKELENISRFINGENMGTINLNNIILANRLINLLKFCIPNNIDPEEMELTLTIDNLGELLGNWFKVRVKLWNGEYDPDDNLILSGTDGGREHEVIFCWAKKVENTSEHNVLRTLIPLYKSNGFV
uniref:Dynein heavy chain, putative n=1 Tax=Theileria annulata TaxID=5874 RepID=A0A3B0MHE3_THEAN